MFCEASLARNPLIVTWAPGECPITPGETSYLEVTKDGGGAAEFVEDQATGFVVEPDPQALAQAIDAIYSDRNRAARLGDRGREKLVSQNISWQNVVEKIVSAAS